MAVAVPKTIKKMSYTVDELLAFGSDARIELIDGEIVQMMAVGGVHQFIGGNIYDVIRPYVKQHDLGFVFFDGLLFLLGKKSKGLKDSYVPDISYISRNDLVAGWNIEKPYPGTPTLAVEIMSPDDSVEIVLRKVREYLKAGSDEVWVVYPQQKEIHQYRRSSLDTVKVYTGDSELDTAALFPGLVLRASEIFALPDLT